MPRMIQQMLLVFIMMGVNFHLLAESSTGLPDVSNKAVADQTASEQAAKPGYLFNGKKLEFKQENEGMASKLWRVFSAFILLIAFTFGILFLYKKYIGQQAMREGYEPRIKIIESRRVNARTNIIILEVDDTQYVLSQSGDQITKLSEKPTKTL